MENFSLNLLIVDYYNSLISEIENQAEYLLDNSDGVLNEIEIGELYKIRNRFIEELMHLESTNINNLYLISTKVNMKLNELKQRSEKIFDLSYLNEIKKDLFQSKFCLFIKNNQFGKHVLRSMRKECKQSIKLGVILILNWFLTDVQIKGLKHFLADPKSFVTLTEDLILYDLILDKIRHSSNCIIELNDKEFYEQMEISIRNKHLIRFDAIDAATFVKFKNLKALSVTFPLKPSEKSFNKTTAATKIFTVTSSERSSQAESDESEEIDSSFSNAIETMNSTERRSFQIRQNQIELLSKKFFNFAININLTSLEELVLSLNSMKRIEPSSFSGFQQLKKLNLSYNKIRDLNSAKIFKGLVNLTELNLSMNSITKLEKEAFAYLSKLIVLDLSSNFIESIEKKSLVGLNSLEELNLRNNCLKLNENSTVKASSPFLNLKKLKILNLADNQLEFIRKPLFKGLTSLTQLILHRNKLRKIEDNVFRFDNDHTLENHTLIKLDLSANLIGKLEKNIFNGLTCLEDLHLYSNQIQSIEELCFQDLKQLKHLDLSCNEMEIIRKEMFLGLINLNALIMSNNAVCIMQENCFVELENLKRLDLSYNRLEELNRNNFSKLKNVEDLSIRVNQIKALEEITFVSLLNLKKLDLSFNKLSHLNKHFFNGLHHLEELKLTSNALVHVDEKAFSDLVKLKSLDLSLNYQIEFNASNRCIFDNLTGLEELNLVPLTKLDTRLFTQLVHLKYLHYHRYKIHVLNREKFFTAMSQNLEILETVETPNSNDKCFDYDIIDYYVWAEHKFK